jgi:sulfite exporter TauE/SafE
MCGPLVASMGLAGARQLPYHLGRVTTYALLGAVMGATGAFVNVAGRLAGLGEVVAVLAGVLMILLGLGVAGVAAPLRRLEAAGGARLHALVRRVGGSAGLYPLGLLLGFLPCGASWTIFLGAAGTGGPVPGLLLALAFGLGTVPGLLLLGALTRLLGQRARGVLRAAGGVAVALLGLLFLLKGLGVHAPL